jgi:hypothetical protein
MFHPLGLKCTNGEILALESSAVPMFPGRVRKSGWVIGALFQTENLSILTNPKFFFLKERLAKN